MEWQGRGEKREMGSRKVRAGPSCPKASGLQILLVSSIARNQTVWLEVGVSLLVLMRRGCSVERRGSLSSGSNTQLSASSWCPRQGRPQRDPHAAAATLVPSTQRDLCTFF